MTSIRLGGEGDQIIGYGTLGQSLPRNLKIISNALYSFAVRGEAYADNQWIPVTYTYFHDGTNFTRILAYSNDLRYYTSLKGGDLGTIDEYASASDARDFAENIEKRILARDNVLIGSKDGGRVVAKMKGGDDYAELHSGVNNFLNGNAGSDDIIIYGGTGRVLGGSSGDNIEIRGGKYGAINGNKGDDYIVNYADLQVNVRGGADNDTIVSASGSMNAFGDKGADTFIPMSGAFMVVKDFQPGLDSLDLSNLEEDYLVYRSGSGLGIGDSLGPALHLEGITSI